MHDRNAIWQSILTAFLVLAPHQVVEFVKYESRHADILIRGLLSGPVGLVVWTGVVFLFMGSGRKQVGYLSLLRALGFSAVGLGIAALANFGVPDASPFKAAAPFLWALPVAMQVQAVTQMSRASAPDTSSTPDTSGGPVPAASGGWMRAAASVLVPVALLAIAGFILIVIALAIFGSV